MPSSWIMFWKRYFHICIYLQRALFQKHDLIIWHWFWNLDFWIGACHVLEKSFSYALLMILEEKRKERAQNNTEWRTLQGWYVWLDQWNGARIVFEGYLVEI